MRIKTLATVVANQIAAGEVIENPASVVKELLENALDAKASAISIEIGFGGLNHIKISDNGCGILAEDLPLAIAPHATSKLTTLNDLSVLTSMGFRGEALASIASISRLTLSSKPATQDTAMKLEAQGNSLQITPCARNQGTTIEVRDLFFNAPVRRRFLKSERSEYLSIEQVVKRFALSAPQVGLTLKHNDKLILNLPAAHTEHTQILRIQKLLGKTFIEQSISLDINHAGMVLTGWLSGPDYQRSQNDKIWVYLNQRMVKDKLILHAIKQAYANYLYPGRYPACVLYFTVPTTQVDINVHPTKHEVRFQQPRLIHDFIESQLHQALLQHRVVEGVSSEWEFPTQDNAAFVKQPLTIAEPSFNKPPIVHAVAPDKPGRWLMINDSFSIMAWNAQLVLVHRQRAHQARVLRLIGQHQLPLTTRPLLVPYVITLPKQGNSIPQEKLLALAHYGITIERTDEQLAVRTIPVILPQLDIKQLMTHLFSVNPHHDDLPKLLADCCASTEDSESLADFVLHHLAQDVTDTHWCRILDHQRCEALMDD